jgi:hypothetical protein
MLTVSVLTRLFPLFICACGAAILKIGSGEILVVVSDTQTILRRQLKVDFSENHILVESSRIAVLVLQEIIAACYRQSICGRRHQWIENIRLCVALAVVVDKEKDPVSLIGPPRFRRTG